MARILMLYRKNDAKSIAGRLGDFLVTRFGERNVLLGAEKLIGVGEDFQDALERGTRGVDAILVLIGKAWTEGGWLSSAEDYDSIVLNTALSEKLRVVPVLVEGAPMPTAADLPEALLGLTRRMSMNLYEDTFREDAEKLVNAVQASIAPGKAVDVRKPKEPSSSGVPMMAGIDSDNNPLFMRAMTNPFKDSEWISKIAVAALLSLIPIVGTVIVSGYGVRYARGLLQGDSTLPKWDDIGGDAGRGLSALIGLFIVSFAFGIVSAVLVGIISAIFLSGRGALNAIGALLLLAVQLGLLVSVFSFGITAVARYVTTDNFSAFLDFGNNWKAVNTLWRRLLPMFGHVLIYGFIMGILIAIGFAFFVIPGWIIAAVASVGGYYFVAEWARQMQQANL
ncbi:MAG: DUF4013 domain-containing protein [Chloroflexi bacterium]|nr:DUF4013 domain-containing protein [Chloroflexota bacterium]